MSDKDMCQYIYMANHMALLPVTYWLNKQVFIKIMKCDKKNMYFQPPGLPKRETLYPIFICAGLGSQPHGQATEVMRLMRSR